MKKLALVLAIITVTINLHAGDYIIDSFYASPQYIRETSGDNYSFTAPVIYIELLDNSNQLIGRTKALAVDGKNDEFFFHKELDIDENRFPIVIHVLVGTRTGYEYTARAGAGAGVGAIAGAVVGGCLGGFFGFGTPCGIGFGIIVGGIVGAGTSFWTPVIPPRKIASFSISSCELLVGTHNKSVNIDSVKDTENIRLIVDEGFYLGR